MPFAAFRASLALAAAIVGAAAGLAQPMPPERDPAEAMREELAIARADGSNTALILFIARYPGTAEAAAARSALADHPDPAPAGGPDGAIVTAFDTARLAGPAALADFAARYSGHPLAAEAASGAWSR